MIITAARDTAAGQRGEMGAGFLCDAHFSIISLSLSLVFLPFQYNLEDGSAILFALTRLRLL